MDTMVIRVAAAAVTGGRHLRSSRNGQDAATVWTGRRDLLEKRGEVAIVVVCDGCSSGASSEVGARLGAALFARSLGARLCAGALVTSRETWAAVRADVVRVLGELVERMPGDRERAIHDHFLFTIVAAAVTTDGAAVWALGDGVYSLGDSTRVLG